MTSKNVLRSQRRRELDARRSKSRVRLGSCLQSWGQLKEELGFTLHSELAQHLLDSQVFWWCERLKIICGLTGGYICALFCSYYSRICIKCSGNKKPDAERNLSTTAESLQELILLVHNHGQKCPLPPVLQSKTITKQPEQNKSVHETGRTVVQSDAEDYGYLSEVDMCLKYTCDGGHHFSWSPIEREKSENERDGNIGDVSPASPKMPRRGNEQLVEPITLRQELPKVTTRQRQGRKHGITLNKSEERSEAGYEMSGDLKNADVTVTETEQDAVHEGGNDETDVSHLSEHNNEETAVLNLTKRGNQRRVDAGDKQNTNRKAGMLKNNCPQSLKDDMSQISGRKKRKITQKVILPCEFVGCDKIFSSRQYLNHHVKYQHLQQKTFSCSHPTCNKSFNFKKHLKEHEKLHSNQRDYICEFCARAFRTSSNLIIHRRIHTGEKPLQCEVCGFTCRQKASLNWHMRKHNAESAYQFPCEICGRRFEKETMSQLTAARATLTILHPSCEPAFPCLLFRNHSRRHQCSTDLPLLLT